MTLRVLHIVDSLSEEAGSLGTCLPGLFRRLDERGIGNDVAVGEVAGKDDACREEHPRVCGPHEVGSAVSEANLVHIHGWDYGLARRAAKLARIAGKPFVIAPHGELSRGPYRRPTWRDRIREALVDAKLVRASAAVLAQNRAEETALAGRWPRVRRLPLGFDVLDVSVAAPQEPSCGRCLLLLGPLDPVEGAVALLKSAAELGPLADAWNVVLAGPDRGGWRGMLEPAIRRKGADGRVRFEPAADTAAQSALLAGAGLVAKPSLHIRPPVSIMQAAAWAKPVLATDCSAPDELRDAIRVCPPSRARLRDALADLLRADDAERAALGQGVQKAAEALDWSVLADRYAALYRELA